MPVVLVDDKQHRVLMGDVECFRSGDQRGPVIEWHLATPARSLLRSAPLTFAAHAATTHAAAPHPLSVAPSLLHRLLDPFPRVIAGLGIKGPMTGKIRPGLRFHNRRRRGGGHVGDQARCAGGQYHADPEGGGEAHMHIHGSIPYRLACACNSPRQAMAAIAVHTSVRRVIAITVRCS